MGDALQLMYSLDWSNSKCSQ